MRRNRDLVVIAPRAGGLYNGGMLPISSALVVVDVQNDFLPGGALAVPGGDAVLEPLNRCLDAFAADGLPVFATRDWHPENHCSFRARGGPWPPHCVAGSAGARFSAALRLPSSAEIVSKGRDPDHDAYSGFEGTDLEERLRALAVRHVFIGGLAGDYCVRATARDALGRGISVSLIEDAIRAIDPEAGRRALAELETLGAARLDSRSLTA